MGPHRRSRTPDLETKVAILKRKADLDGIDLSDEIAIYIAGKVKSNVRELEGSLVRLVAIASLRQVPISKAIAQEAMKNFVDGERRAGLTIERIARRRLALRYDDRRAKVRTIREQSRCRGRWRCISVND